VVYKRRKTLERSKKMRKQRQENLLRLLTLTAFLFLLAFVFAADPVYAPQPDWIDPGDPGSGTPNSVSGQILSWSTGAAARGIKVYLYTYTGLMSTTTNHAGCYEFIGGACFDSA